MSLVEILQLVVIPLVLAVLRDVRSTRAELVNVRERVAALETAVEISLGVNTHNRRRGD